MDFQSFWQTTSRSCRSSQVLQFLSFLNIFLLELLSRPGACFRLIPESQWSTLIDQTPPEILRTPLQSFCLTIGSLLGDRIGVKSELVAECLTPPEPVHVESAIRTLTEIGAIDDGQKLTSLGKHLTKMPMDVHIGKMLIYGALLRTVDSVLTLAAALSYGRPIFLSPPEHRDQAGNFRQEVYSIYQNSKSDHMAIIAAFHAFHRAKINSKESSFILILRGLDSEENLSVFCRRRFISLEAMNSILDNRVEFASILAELGFVSWNYAQEVNFEQFLKSIFWMFRSRKEELNWIRISTNLHLILDSFELQFALDFIQI